MAQKPSIPKGTRDFSPSEVVKRNYIFDTVKRHFKTFGFQPIETPSFENSDTLLGKYGDEGDRLIFKILDSGDYLSKIKRIVSDTDFFVSFQKEVIEKLKPKIDSLNIDVDKFSDNAEYRNNLLDDLISKKEILKNVVDVYAKEKNSFVDFLNDKETAFFIASKSLKLYIEILIRTKSIAFHKMDLFIEQIINEKAKSQIYDGIKSNKASKYLSEKALRYDLTVPFARYVVMHQNEIDFPFKRYQIQPVWRADRPQKGRFREFYQCDADVVGSTSLLQEVELVQLYDSVFTDLKLEGVNIKLNNRKILAGIAEVIGAKHLLIDFTVALDKLDKIGPEKVKQEMLNRGLSKDAIAKVEPLFSISGTNSEQLNVLENLLKDSEEGTKGVSELRFIVDTINELGLQSAQLSIDVTLARGLNYYTGAIFEVAAPKGVQIGSIGGGGRYDDLTGIFGLKDVSGVGISFGLDRIYLVIEELNLFPQTIDKSLDVLCLNYGEKEALASLRLITTLRKCGIKADLYPAGTKIQKQFKYADKRNVPYVIIIGEEELKNNSFAVKNMKSGEQKTYDLTSPDEFIDLIK
ncbi:histidine--tRNA ligase [Costertonia aggregata]|uniref:Histidine--tRNA ligase n=1 Tax=Costertonia aggregata TaxID=343403 RepID=A0A7H9AKE4_9FLAO|nr:histidine--tRNA ligase [Costertonia aggregata]QLG43887.1 histidine--tRNA ligase [Costertonia aggregata]